MLEVMTVVAIIGIATALALPNFANWLARSELKESMAELQGNLNMARMTAMNRNTTITATLAIVNNRVNVTFTDPTSNQAACTADNQRCILPTQVMPSRVTGFSGTASIQFNSLGMRIGGGTAAQAIRLTNNQGTTFELQVTSAGKSRWCTTSPCP
jgi:Tfp pilus assembly protein FimT